MGRHVRGTRSLARCCPIIRPPKRFAAGMSRAAFPNRCSLVDHRFGMPTADECVTIRFQN